MKETIKKVGVPLLMALGVIFLIGVTLVLIKPSYKDGPEFTQALNEGKVQEGDKIEFTVKDTVKNTVLADTVIHTDNPRVVYLFQNPGYINYGETYKYPILSTEKVMGIWVIVVDNPEEEN